MQRFLIVLTAAALAAGAAAASAQGIGVTVKLLDFDVSQPDRADYRDSDLGHGLIDSALAQAWGELSGAALDPVRHWLAAPDRLGPGMTARDIEIRLGKAETAQMESTGQSKGRLTVPVKGNAIDLTSTHPASRGKWMDPRLRLEFDMTLTVDFLLVAQAPHVRAMEAVLQPGNVRVSPLNFSAGLGLSFDELVSTLGGTRSIESRIRSAFEAAPIAVTGSLNAQLRSQAGALALPPGYLFNGGRVEPGRILIAGWRQKPYAATRLTVSATWPQDLGTLMNDCAPVGIGARWRSGPRPFSGAAEAPQATAAAQSVTLRHSHPRGGGYTCSTTLNVPPGAPLSITWADPVRVPAGGHAAAMKAVIVAHPSGWANPVLARSSPFELALSRELRPGTGVQLDAAARARQNPLDPVTRGGQAADPLILSPRTASPAATGASPPGGSVGLNPQPLPPRAVATPSAIPSQSTFDPARSAPRSNAPGPLQAPASAPSR